MRNFEHCLPACMVNILLFTTVRTTSFIPGVHVVRVLLSL